MKVRTSDSFLVKTFEHIRRGKIRSPVNVKPVTIYKLFHFWFFVRDKKQTKPKKEGKERNKETKW